jgi:glycerol-3-phosphate dehydrogenase subunit C
MSERSECHREGSLEAPTRHPIRWQEPGFYDEAAPNAELARVFDVCHGCRRCVSLCNAFDLVANSPTWSMGSIRHTAQWSNVIYTISAI